MSYNIRSIKTLSSSLTITARNAKIIMRDFDLPECSFMDDLDLDDPDLEPADEFEIDRLTWIYTSSGNLFDSLKTILKDYCKGEGEFIVIWEDGDARGLKVTGEGADRKVTQPKVKMVLE